MSISSTLCRACPNSYFNSFINWTNKLLAQNISVKANSTLQSITYLLNGGIVSRYLTASLFSYSICHMCCLQIVRLLDHRRRLYCSYLSAELQPFHPERARPELQWSRRGRGEAAEAAPTGHTQVWSGLWQPKCLAMEKETLEEIGEISSLIKELFFFIYINFAPSHIKEKQVLHLYEC